MPKYYPIIKQMYILRKFCTVPQSFVSDLLGRLIVTSASYPLIATWSGL